VGAEEGGGVISIAFALGKLIDQQKRSSEVDRAIRCSR
jgi:hypothetical protein